MLTVQFSRLIQLGAEELRGIRPHAAVPKQRLSRARWMAKMQDWGRWTHMHPGRIWGWQGWVQMTDKFHREYE